MATHSSILAWKILWTEEPGRLHSMGSQKSQIWLSDRAHNKWGKWNPAKSEITLPRAHPNISVQVSCSVMSNSSLWDPIDYILPSSSVCGIFQARILEWVAISFSRGSSQPRDWARVSRIVDRRFTIWATKYQKQIFYFAVMWNSISIMNTALSTVSNINQLLIPFL